MQDVTDVKKSVWLYVKMSTDPNWGNTNVAGTEGHIVKREYHQGQRRQEVLALLLRPVGHRARRGVPRDEYEAAMASDTLQPQSPASGRPRSR